MEASLRILTMFDFYNWVAMRFRYARTYTMVHISSNHFSNTLVKCQAVI